MTKEAVNCQAYGHTKQIETPKTTSRGHKDRPKGDHSASKPSSSSTKMKPICPFPPHKAKGLRHYLKDCRECPDDQKDKLFEEMGEQRNKGIKRTSAKRTETQSSVIFSATFANKVRTNVFADIGACATLMDSDTLSKLEQSGVEAEVETLPKPVTFNMAAKNADGTETSILCDRTVTVDTQLHIRHGSALVLHRLRWFITPQSVGEPLLGRPLLEGLGLDCHKILGAAAERHGGSVDVSHLVGNQADHYPGRIGRIVDGVFHADGGADDADLDDEDGWLDLGPEHPNEKEEILNPKL